MDKPCVIVELDPTDLERGRTIVTAALSLFHTDVDVVLTLTGVEEPTPVHGDKLAAMCAGVGGGAALPDVTLEGVGESARRDPLLKVIASDDPAATVEAIVLLTSIALRSWGATEPESAGPSSEIDKVVAWLNDRNAVIAQRDGMVDPRRAPHVVVIAASRTGLTDAQQLLSALRARGCAVDVVATGPHANRDSLRRRGHKLGHPVRDVAWFSHRLESPASPLTVALYVDRPTDDWPAEVKPERAAEYGVRVAYLTGASERLDADVTADSYDTPVHRIAWRNYVPTARHEVLFTEHNRVGAGAVRVVGALRTARTLAEPAPTPPAAWVAAAAGRPVVLWCPTVSFRGGDSALRRYLDVVVSVAAKGDVAVLVRLDTEQQRLLESLHDGPDLMARLRQAQDAGHLLCDLGFDAAPALRFADALICGVDGPIGTFVATDRPVLYTYRRDVAPVLRGAEYALALDVTADAPGIERFCAAVAAGGDDRGEARSLAAKAYFSLDDLAVPERIADDIVYSLAHEAGHVTFDAALPLLSVAMIVKNEERNLPRALSSLTGLGDVLHEVCVYDTGSSDDTVAIARSFGAVVQEGYWNGDFARARNAAIDMCTSQWVLIMDADETVTADAPSMRRTLYQALMATGGGVDALDVTVRDLDAAAATKSEWASHRLLRPQRARYRGEVHEDVFRLDGSLVSAVRIDQGVIRIDHDGYNDAALLTDKLARNADIAQAEVAAREQAGDVEALIRALVDRARSRLAAGGVGEAVADYERVRRMSTTRTYRWWGMEQYVSVLLQLGRVDDAQSVVDELVAEGASPSFSRWLQARVLSTRGDYETAYSLLSQIDRLTDSLGMAVPQAALLDPKLELAVRLGHLDEALAHLIALMAGCGQVAERGPLFVRLWGDRDVAALAELVSTADPDHLRRMAAELDEAPGRGSDLAAVVRSMVDESAGVNV